MIKIPKRLYARLIEYARNGAPEEVCGLIGGTERDGIREAREIYFLENAAHSETRFFMTSAEQFAAIRDMRAKKIKLIGCFHSHPKTAANPSAEDLRLAYDKNISYVIISLKGGADIKSFRVTEGAPSQETVAPI